MKSPNVLWNEVKNQIKESWKVAFLSAMIIGLMVHMPIMLSDIPNHDGLDSLYFDQNMITSGRWFLTIACGFSSYYTLPWLIGLISVLFLALAAVCVTEFLELKSNVAIILCSGMLVTFPSLASTFAYVFTMDGYMLALLLAVAAPLCVKKCRGGVLWGGLCLALSMGTYQAYLPFAVLLSIYGILLVFMKECAIRDKVFAMLRYLLMGIVGVVSYYVILRILLWIQGKELASYQGISSMGNVERTGLFSVVKEMYTDFLAFSLRGNVLFNNLFSIMALCVLAGVAIFLMLTTMVRKKWYKSVWFYVVGIFVLFGLPIATNLILVISPDVTYHLLMRYQWILYPIICVALIDHFQDGKSYAQWGLLLAGAVLVFNYAVTDQVAYSNLEKRYEKTYAYCVRLLDRIEQTEGYYQGMPIAMIGVVGDESYPLTDLTGNVTASMIGISGDSLLYTGNNYELFVANYLGATLNILPPEAMSEMYYDERYRKMESFPGKDSIRIIDGIMYVKTENIE